MKKMIKTAIVTTSILASASVFAQSAEVNANGSAQVNVQSGGLLKGVTGAVKNTAQGVGHVAQGVGHTAHNVGHAAVNTGVTATQKTVGTATHIGSHVVNKTGEAVKNTKDYAVDKAVDGKEIAADTTANVKKRIEDKKASNQPKSLNLGAQTNAQAQVNGKTSGVNAQTGLNADKKGLQTGANVGVKVLGVNANVNTNAKIGAN
ncbi:hypothetical protein AWW72_08275 [Acinetobacter sp. NRRL B-65365]|uniref:hypothetical protein n=1 Tax=Acinetobacter sp. NRRL B-65365 TaxID=1785092 RepID=UPI0007A0CAD2|nr:hypothetical protein [Acinetobacter sp. NRRL B-65365]KYQ84627.1 hypothetical protein AWW72_08275 [Acinetobacter sp. NRRL B-65365]